MTSQTDIAFARLKAGSPRGALEILDTIPSSQVTAISHFYRAIAYYRLEDAPRAAQAARAALDLEPRMAPAALYLALALYDQGRIDQAIKYAQIAVRLDPNRSPEARRMLRTLGAPIPSAPRAHAARPAGRRPAQAPAPEPPPQQRTTYWLPQTEDEWKILEDGLGRYQVAEKRPWFSSLPWTGKALVVGVAVFILLTGRQVYDKSPQEDFKKHREQIDSDTCQKFEGTNVQPPGC